MASSRYRGVQAGARRRHRWAHTEGRSRAHRRGLRQARHKAVGRPRPPADRSARCRRRSQLRCVRSRDGSRRERRRSPRPRGVSLNPDPSSENTTLPDRSRRRRRSTSLLRTTPAPPDACRSARLRCGEAPRRGRPSRRGSTAVWAINTASERPSATPRCWASLRSWPRVRHRAVRRESP